MDNYEINILRRDGNWKKVNPNDRIMDSLEENEALEKKSINSKDEKSKDDFLYYLNEVNFIIVLYIIVYCQMRTYYTLTYRNRTNK